MRILIELKSMDSHVIENMTYHKLQGFVFKKLITPTSHKYIHDITTYKYFCFSNIFPRSNVRKGETRKMIFSSPNEDLVEAIYRNIVNMITIGEHFNIGTQLFQITAARLLKIVLTNNKCSFHTSTPITVRIPEKSYDVYHIPEDVRKNKFLYWRSGLPIDVFLRLIQYNMQKKFESFFKTKMSTDDFRFIEELSYMKEIIVAVPFDTKTTKFPGSFWSFDCNITNANMIRVINFIIDCGFGERNSYGLGFLNPISGFKTIKVAQVSGARFA